MQEENIVRDSRPCMPEIKEVIRELRLHTDNYGESVNIVMVKPNFELFNNRSVKITDSMIEKKLQFILVMRSKASTVKYFELSPVYGRVWHKDHLIFANNRRKWDIPTENYIEYGDLSFCRNIIPPSILDSMGVMYLLDTFLDTLTNALYNEKITISDINNIDFINIKEVLQLIYDIADIDYVINPISFIDKVASVMTNISNIDYQEYRNEIFINSNSSISSIFKLLNPIRGASLPKGYPTWVCRIRTKEEFKAQYELDYYKNQKGFERTNGFSNIPDTLYSDNIFGIISSYFKFVPNLFDSYFVSLNPDLFECSWQVYGRYTSYSYTNIDTIPHNYFGIVPYFSERESNLRDIQSNMPHFENNYENISYIYPKDTFNFKYLFSENSLIGRDILIAPDSHEFYNNTKVKIALPFSMLDFNSNVLIRLGSNVQIKVIIPESLPDMYHYPYIWDILKGKEIILPGYINMKKGIKDTFVYTHQGNAIPAKYFEIKDIKGY